MKQCNPSLAALLRPLLSSGGWFRVGERTLANGHRWLTINELIGTREAAMVIESVRGEPLVVVIGDKGRESCCRLRGVEEIEAAGSKSCRNRWGTPPSSPLNASTDTSTRTSLLRSQALEFTGTAVYVRCDWHSLWHLPTYVLS